jgi:hypothetical protein
MSLVSISLKERLVSVAEAADRSTEWPADSWQILKESGAFGWSISFLYGGSELVWRKRTWSGRTTSRHGRNCQMLFDNRINLQSA